MHLWKECVMLGTCDLCQQIIELSTMNFHLMEECKFKGEMKQCQKCKVKNIYIYHKIIFFNKFLV